MNINSIDQHCTASIERYNFACKIAKSKSVLDIACGPGHSSRLFLAAGANSYDGVDINEEHISYAKYKYSEAHPEGNRINYHIGDTCSFNNGQTFDIITCYNITEHIYDYESAFDNLYQLLNYGGVLFISSDNRMSTRPPYLTSEYSLSGDSSIHAFTPNELLGILANSGFTVNHEKIFGQYHRKVYSKEFINKIVQSICKKCHKRDADDAVVTEVRDKVPEHFIVVATKV